MTRHIAFALAGCLALVGACQAGQISGDFTILNGAPSPSGGLVTFTLNGDGTISASMVSYGDTVQGFGFDSVLLDLPESNFSPTAVDNANGWSDMYGSQYSGFYCSACGLTETWTIGTTGEFSSVFDALGGGNSTYPLFFISEPNGDQWAADAVASTASPEPSSLMLLGAGVLGLAYRLRRRLSQAPR